MEEDTWASVQQQHPWGTLTLFEAAEMKRPNGDSSKVDGSKRDFWYSLMSVVVMVVGVWSLEGLVEGIIAEREIPGKALLLLTGLEVGKVLLAFALFPSPHLLDPHASATQGGKPAKLPIRRDSPRATPLYPKIVEVWKTFWNFVMSCALCHLLMILFGAPVLEDFVLTLQFSVIVVNWTFFPLCLAIRPSFVLYELAYISIWNTQVDTIFRAKWRFLICVLGTMVGAAFIPLDWDRPWQKWPITCLISSAVAYLAVHLFSVIYLFATVYCSNFKIPFLNRSSNKMKYF